MELIWSAFRELLFFFNEIAIYLLFGFLVAGVLHVVFPDSFIRKHLGKSSVGSVIKSTLFGIPLPICSCGVIPVATSLKNSGASRGATISFLISTPQVGADSFMITYSLLGWVFGVFRIVSSLITALVAGILVNLVGKDGDAPFFVTSAPVMKAQTMAQRARSMPGYVEYTLLGSIADRLIIGIVLAALISIAIPDHFFQDYLNSDFLSMLLMLVIGIPMYVCASASTPIAAALIMKGISPGAALIFLLTGPATNIIGISAVHKIVGRTSTLLYLAVISIGSLLLGYGLNLTTNYYGFSNVITLSGMDMLPNWLKIMGSIGLFSMLAWFYIKTKWIDKTKEKTMASNTRTLSVEGMSCNHCSGTVHKTLESIKGISEVNVDLEGKKATFITEDDGAIQQAIDAVIKAGFTASVA